MYSIKPNGPNRLDLDISGKIDSTEMTQLLDELMEQSAQMDNGLMLYKINDFDLPTFGAIGVEMSKLPGLFKLMRRFSRIALIADQMWIRAAGEIEGVLIPGLSIKAFEHADQASAETWLAS